MSPKMQELLKQFKLNIAGMEGFDLPREIGGGGGLRFNMFTKGGPSLEVVMLGEPAPGGHTYYILDGKGEELHMGDWRDYLDVSVEPEDLDILPFLYHLWSHYDEYMEKGTIPRFDESAPRFLKKMRTK